MKKTIEQGTNTKPAGEASEKTRGEAQAPQTVTQDEISLIAETIKAETTLRGGDVSRFIEENNLFNEYGFNADDKERLNSELHDLADIDRETVLKVIQEISEKLKCDVSEILYIWSGMWVIYLPIEYKEMWDQVNIDLPFGVKIERWEQKVLWLYDNADEGRRVFLRLESFINSKYGTRIYNGKPVLSLKERFQYPIDILWLNSYGLIYAKQGAQFTPKDYQEINTLINNFIREQEELAEQEEQEPLAGQAEPEPVHSEYYQEPEKDLLTVFEQRRFNGSSYSQFPGLMGKIYGFLMDNAFKPDSELAQATTMAVMSFLVNHTYHVIGLGGKPVAGNLYILATGESGSGKDYGRQFIKELLDRLQIPHCVSENYKSFPGIEADLRGKKNGLGFNPRIWLCDEVGQFLEATKSRGTNQYTKEIPTGLLKLYTSSLSKYFPARGADCNDPKYSWSVSPIESPYLVLYGTSTPNVLFQSFSSAEIETGLIGRLMIFASRARAQAEYSPIQWESETGGKIPVEIINEASFIFGGGQNWSANQDGSMLFPQIKKEIPIDETGKAEFDKFNKWLTKQTRSAKKEYPKILLRRCLERSIKLSMFWAVAFNPENPVINEYCAYWGIFYTKKILYTLLDIIENNVADTETERIFKAFLQYLRKRGGRVSGTEASNGFFRKLTKAERDTLKQNIMESVEVVEEIDKTTSDKGTRFYVLTGRKMA